MATLELTDDAFAETIDNNDIVIIDFWADWCGPCKTFAPTFEKVSENHPDIVFAKCDTEKEQMLATQFGIKSIPTLVILRERVVLLSQAGVLPESAFEDIISQVRALDMDGVRAAIEEEQPSQQAPTE